MGYTRQLKANKTSEATTKPSKGAPFGFVDNRETAAIHQSLQQSANETPTQLKSFNQTTNGVIQCVNSDWKLRLRKRGPIKTGNTKDRVKKSNNPVDRIRRARERGEGRTKLPTLGTRINVSTPMGIVGLSQQRYNKNDPQITTKKSDFPGTKPVGATYKEWEDVIGTGKNKWSHIAAAMKEGKKAPKGIFSPQEGRAAAALIGTTQTAENYRHFAAAKVARGAARKMALEERKKGSKKTSFTSYCGMAKPKGGQHLHRVERGEETLTPQQSDAIAEMSESSDDDA